MTIAAIMPCRGRAAQTVANVRRLLVTAGLEQGPDTWHLICMVDHDAAVMGALANADLPVWRADTAQRGYWRALQQATDQWPAEFSHLVNLANDLLPGHQWLRRAMDAYREAFGDGPGLLGFNDGIHELGHSPHFLIDRRLLERFGGWPVWYSHTFGDTELCERAIAAGLYAKAPWAVLYHDHWITGGQPDAVYREGDATAEADRRLFEQRKRQGWPVVSP